MQDALRQLRYAAHRAFESAHGDAEKLKSASADLEAVNRFHRNLIIAIQDGKAASKKIDRELQGGRFVRGIGSLVRSRRPTDLGMPWDEDAVA